MPSILIFRQSIGNMFQKNFCDFFPKKEGVLCSGQHFSSSANFVFFLNHWKEKKNDDAGHV